MTKSITIYTWHEDPGHAWLAVPRADVDAAGVLSQISGYSYFRDDVLYLEEDCDAPMFLDAAGLMEAAQAFPASHVNSDSRIRSYAHWSGR